MNTARTIAALVLFSGISLAVPAPKNLPVKMLPGHVDMTWNGVPWDYEFKADGTCITRGHEDVWMIEETEACVTVRLTWNGSWFIFTINPATGEGWGSICSVDQWGVESYPTEVKVKCSVRKVMPKGPVQ